MSHGKHCPRCGAPRELASHPYCRACHASYMRDWRKTHPLTEAQRYRAAARSYANVYQRRGKLMPQPCEVCGEKAQKHHPDYARPLEVRWLCRQHHLEAHQ